MATNLAIDDRLLEEARKIGGQKTKRQVTERCTSTSNDESSNWLWICSAK
jgi:hypothetical protein